MSPGWIGWVMMPRCALRVLHATAMLIGIIIVARAGSLRAFAFWGIVFAICALILLIWRTSIFAETILSALTGEPAWPIVWLSFVPGWFWDILAVAAPIAGAVCALRLNRRWNGALCPPVRVWLLAISTILIAVALWVSRYFHDDLEPGSAAFSGVMALMAVLLLLSLAWQIWLLIELQRAARRLGRLAQAG